MGKPKKKRKGRIKISSRAQLIHKNDKTRVASRDTIGATLLKKAPTQMPRDNGLNMRVKIRRKTK